MAAPVTCPLMAVSNTAPMRDLCTAVADLGCPVAPAVPHLLLPRQEQMVQAPA